MPGFPAQYAPFVLAGRSRHSPKPQYPKRFWRLVGVTHYPHRVDGEMVPIGGLYLVQPGQVVDIQRPDDDQAMSVDFLVIASKVQSSGGRAAYELSADAPDQPNAEAIWGIPMPTVLPQQLWPWALARLQLITGLWWKDERSHFKANMRLNEILEHLSDTLIAQAGPKNNRDPLQLPDWFLAIERAAEHRINTLRKVSDLAAIAGMSSAHFSRRFHEVVGQPPATWLRERRLVAAADLLRTTDYTAEHIARAIGISAAALKHGFQQRFGCTPKQWRNRRLGR